MSRTLEVWESRVHCGAFSSPVELVPVCDVAALSLLLPLGIHSIISPDNSIHISFIFQLLYPLPGQMTAKCALQCRGRAMTGMKQLKLKSLCRISFSLQLLYLLPGQTTADGALQCRG